jgi:hypothetical protein
MANRHGHKKLRAEIRARMATTGEGYQLARQRILSRAAGEPSSKGEFFRTEYFGVSLTFAIWEAHGLPFGMLVPGGGGRAPARVRALSPADARLVCAPPRPLLLRLIPRGVLLSCARADGASGELARCSREVLQ